MGALSSIERDLGEHLRAIREAIPMTQREVAAELRCSVRSLQDYEAGKSWPRPAVRRRIDAWLAEHAAKVAA